MVGKLLTSIAALLMAGMACATPRLTKEELKRSVYINGVIGRGNMEGIGQYILAKSNAEPSKAVNILINSPGGSVMEGFKFINYMNAVKANGTPIRCFVSGMAASMAFQILLHCNERYALSKSFLLWHRVRVFLFGAVLTGPAALSLFEDLHRADHMIIGELKKFLGLSDDVVMDHLEKETLHVGSQLSELAPDFLTTYDSIPGLLEASASNIPKSSMPGDDNKLVFKPGTIIYIYQGE